MFRLYSWLSCSRPLSPSLGADVGTSGLVQRRGLRGAGQHVHGAGGRRLPAQDHDTHVSDSLRSMSQCKKLFNVCFCVSLLGI